MAWLYFDHSLFPAQSSVLKDALYIVTSTLALYWIFGKGIRKIRASEKALAGSEERLASILETAASGIFVLNASGAVTFANRSAEIILGMGA